MKPHKFIPTHLADFIWVVFINQFGKLSYFVSMGFKNTKRQHYNPSFHAGDKILGLIYRHFVKSNNPTLTLAIKIH